MIANVSLGRISKATEIGLQLAERTAKEPQKQREIAIRFADLSNADAQSLAKQCWRRVVSATKDGSIEWLSAKLGILKALIRLNQFDDARKLLASTKVLYPEPGRRVIEKPNSMRSKRNFNQSLASCKSCADNEHWIALFGRQFRKLAISPPEVCQKRGIGSTLINSSGESPSFDRAVWDFDEGRVAIAVRRSPCRCRISRTISSNSEKLLNNLNRCSKSSGMPSRAPYQAANFRNRMQLRSRCCSDIKVKCRTRKSTCSSRVGSPLGACLAPNRKACERSKDPTSRRSRSQWPHNQSRDA